MPALWIAHSIVEDPDAYAEYARVAGECIAEHGGVFLARGGRYMQLEGPDHPRNVVARFARFEDAVACYRSEKYQSVVGSATAAARRSIVIVETTEPDAA